MSKEFEFTGWWLGYHDSPLNGSSEGHGTLPSFGHLHGRFNFIEDQPTDEDWYQWGEHQALYQHFYDNWRGFISWERRK